MLKLLINFILLIQLATSQHIELKWERRPVYISKMISEEHRDSIYNAMIQLDLNETEDKTENHIRIEYERYNGGGIEMLAATDYDGFYIYKTVIGINRLLDNVMFQCISLHELGHSLGLAHRDVGVMRPIINITENYCYLDIEDYINLWKILN